MEGALAEYRKHFVDNGFGVAPGLLAPRDLVSVDVRVEPVLNLTSAEVRADLGIALEHLVGDTKADLAACRRTAWEDVRSGHRGILAPSAAKKGERTLMLYVESDRGRLVVSNDPDRISINYGPNPLFT